MGFRAFDLPTQDFFEWRDRKIALIFNRHSPRSSLVVEVGCGLGKNLLALARHGFTNLVGIDPCPAAIAGLRARSRRLNLPIRCYVADVLRASTFVHLTEGSTIFTNYVLEQLPEHAEEAVADLVAAKLRTVIHLEPCASRDPLRSAWERWPSAMHAWANDYQFKLLPVLRWQSLEGRLVVKETLPLGTHRTCFTLQH